MPPLLLKAAAWFNAHGASKVFALVWASVNGASSESEWDLTQSQSEASSASSRVLAVLQPDVNPEDRIRRFVGTWAGLASGIISGTLTFAELEPFAEVLCVESEMALFIRSATAATFADFNFQELPVRASRASTDKIRQTHSSFRVIQRARHNIAGTKATLQLLAQLVSKGAAGAQSVASAIAAMDNLSVLVASLIDWGGTTVSALAELAAGAEGVDERIYSLSDDLLAELKSQEGFLDWLAEAFPPPDNNFTSAVEMGEHPKNGVVKCRLPDARLRIS